MTTISVRAYADGVREKLGLVEEECTKFMTGGIYYIYYLNK